MLLVASCARKPSSNSSRKAWRLSPLATYGVTSVGRGRAITLLRQLWVANQVLWRLIQVAGQPRALKTCQQHHGQVRQEQASSGSTFSASRRLSDTVLAASRPTNVPTCATPSADAARMQALR